MERDAKKQEIFDRMTPEERKIAEEKRKIRAAKKQNPTKNNKSKNEVKKDKAACLELIQVPLSKSDKHKKLENLEYQISLIRFGKEKSTTELLKKMDELLSIEDYSSFRDDYIGIIRNAFCIRTVQITDPTKNKAADFLDRIMNEVKIVEPGLILGLLTEGYISKTLARILVRHSRLIIDAGYGEFVLRFVREIRDRKGNLNEDGTTSPFTPAQKKRVDDLFEIYKSSISQKTLEEWHQA